MTTMDFHLFDRSNSSALSRWWWRTDQWMLGAVLLLITVGVMLSFGASPAAAARIDIGNPFYFALRQSLFALISTIILIRVSMLSGQGVRRVGFFVYLAATAIMIALPFIGHEAKGATRWLHLGGFSLQPSEFMKPALVIMVAWMFTESQKRKGVPGVAIAAALWALAVLLLLTEKDFGQTLLTTSTLLAMFFLIGIPLIWVVGLGALAIGGAVVIASLNEHVRDRLAVHFASNPGDATQIGRASEAIALGGLTGRGPGEGLMKRLVPDMHTDFIYSVGAEEFGLAFSALLILLFGFIVCRGLHRAMRLQDPFEQIAAAGLFMLFGQQAFINIAVNLGMIPTKGMTLPFISYGGSSVVAMGLTMGLALALISKRPGAYGSGADDSHSNP